MALVANGRPRVSYTETSLSPVAGIETPKSLIWLGNWKELALRKEARTLDKHTSALLLMNLVGIEGFIRELEAECGMQC